MQLITMAHLGEAQSVIDQFKLQKVGPSLFEGEDLLCLITGEGPFEAATATAGILGQKKITKVINIGIAGAIDPELTIGEIHPVRTVYLVIEGRPQFKSFPSLKKGLDCLTSFERILHQDKAQILQGLGQLVDREAWGVAMAAKAANVPFEAYKLISDHAGSLGACELVKEDAAHWSQMIAEHLAASLSHGEEIKPANELSGFYFTFSTQHQYQDMFNKLALRLDKGPAAVLESLPIEELRQKKILPKERTKILLQMMEARLDPLKPILEEKLQQWKAPWEKRGIHLHTDPQWEGPQIKVSFSIESEEELKKKLKELEDLNIKLFHDLRNGKIHVE